MPDRDSTTATATTAREGVEMERRDIPTGETIDEYLGLPLECLRRFRELEPEIQTPIMRLVNAIASGEDRPSLQRSVDALVHLVAARRGWGTWEELEELEKRDAEWHA